MALCADAVAMYQPEKGGKEKVIPELRSSSLGDLPSKLTRVHRLKKLKFSD